MSQIACIGEVMIELSPIDAETARIGVAGDTYNTAVYLRRSLDPSAHQVRYVTALGDDVMSQRIVSALRTENLDTSAIEIRKGASPGLYAISRDSRGERSFSYWRSEAAARSIFIEPCDVTLDRLDSADLVYLSGISLAILPQKTRDAIYAWVDGYRARGGTIAFDSNYRPRLWENVDIARHETMNMWRRCDIALPSLDDELALFEETDENGVLERLASAGVRFGALKRAERGPRSLDQNRATLSVPPVENVVDTTAAGDSFNAGFLAGWVAGRQSEACMAMGHALSAIVIQYPGAIIPETAMQEPLLLEP